MNDTRKDARLSVALITRYREPTMLEPREGECRDLSLSGMFITTQRPSPRGALIRFECVSDRPDDGFRGTGRVVWHRNKADERGPAGMGVRFVRLEAGGREALERTIDRVGSERPISRTPRPSNRAPAKVRSRQEEALTQAVPIFAAGTASSTSGTAQPSVVQTPLPPAGSSHTARFPQLRSSTLRGVAIPGEVKRISSNPPPGSAAAGNTPLPPPPRTPAPAAAARADSNGEQRDRLDRTRRGVGPSQSDNEASGVSPVPTPVPPAAPEGTASDSSAASPSDRPTTRPKAATSDRPGRPTQQGTALREVASSESAERPAREHQSDRPPRPGGIDDLRAIPAQQPASSPPADAGARPREVAFARTTMKEVAHGLRGATSVRSEPEAGPLPPMRSLSANAGFPRGERDTTEKRIPIAGDGARHERGSAPDFEPEHSSSRWLLWLIAGTGLLMSYLVVRVFGGALPGIPGETISPDAASSAKAASKNSNTQEAHAPYTLAITTQPVGARISAAGQSLVAPGSLHIDSQQLPLQVVAELAGYENATATVWPSQFERNGNAHEGKVELTLKRAADAPPIKPGAPAAKEAPTAKPAAAAAAAPAQPAPPAKIHDSSRSNATASGPASRQRNDSPTPSRRATKAASVTIKPSAPPPDPPAPEPPAPSPQVAVASPAAPPTAVQQTAQQTPMAEALDCLARGDNRCVIRALEGKVSSAREFELLIETYRAVGSTPRAEREMQSYLERFPEGQRAPEYRRLLERRASNPSPDSVAPTPQTP